MQVKLVLLFSGLMLVACGAEQSSSDPDQADNASRLDQARFVEDDLDSEFGDYVEGDDPELGRLVVELTEDNYNNVAYCSLIVIRVVDEGFANVMLTMSLEGDPLLPSALDLRDDDLTSGEINLSGVQYSSSEFSMASMDYVAPRLISDGQNQNWVFDFYDPRGSFAMSIDGEAFDVYASGDRDADNLALAPHLWEVSMRFESGLLKTAMAGEELRSTGKFNYDGLCTVAINYLEL